MKMGLLSVAEVRPKDNNGHISAFCRSHKVSHFVYMSSLIRSNCSWTRQSVEYDPCHQPGDLGHNLVVCRVRTSDC